MQKFASAKKEIDVAVSAQRVFDLISDELVLVEVEFERQASSNIQVINYLGEYLSASGGKRVRPALLILANKAVGGDGAAESAIRLATVMEMLHTATLVHDDIIDNADLRRGRSSINSRFGNQTAVLMGDWLYMSAFETSLKERSLEILDILTVLTRKMTEGELIQLTAIGRLDITESEYFDILERKTAYLFSACCEIGAIIGGANSTQQAALKDYGLHLGIAFQLVDDILDVTQDTTVLGKAAGSDLLEGKLTLPLIYLVQKEPSLLLLIEKVMLSGTYDAIRRDELYSKLTAHGIIDSLRERINEHSTLAIKSLDVLPESEYRSCLEAVLNYITERNK
jgi:octaprenyl-diphosphate synthase